MNKQKGEKRKPAFLTNLVGMLVNHYIDKQSFYSDPRQLCVVTDDSNLIKFTSSRRFDSAFPDIINPVAVWEIKEYYYTTTFGSRIADGVYESLLDGYELAELNKNSDIEVLHYIFVDAYHTFWDMGKAYLCRFVDLLNMGYADEIIFGSEVVEKIPELSKIWLSRVGEA